MAGYGMGATMSPMAGAMARMGARARWPASIDPTHATRTTKRQRSVAVLGDERQRRHPHQDRDEGQALGCVNARGKDLAHHVGRGREHDGAAHEPVHGMEAGREPRGDAEVAAAAAEAPEEVRLTLGVHRDDVAVRGDHLDCDEGVDGQAVLAHQPADAATQRQAADADRRGVAVGGREAVCLRGGSILARRQARTGLRDARVGIDVHRAQVAQVEQDRVIHRAVARETVAAAPDGQRQVLVPGQPDGGRDIGGVRRPDDG